MAPTSSERSGTVAAFGGRPLRFLVALVADWAEASGRAARFASVVVAGVSALTFGGRPLRFLVFSVARWATSPGAAVGFGFMPGLIGPSGAGEADAAAVSDIFGRPDFFGGFEGEGVVASTMTRSTGASSPVSDGRWVEDFRFGRGGQKGVGGSASMGTGRDLLVDGTGAFAMLVNECI